MLSPEAIIESTQIGEGTRVWHFTHIRESAEVGKGCNIGEGVYIDKNVRIGNNVKIQNHALIYQGVIIEDDVFIAPSVVFTNDRYPRAYIWDEKTIPKTIIKKGASIGANSTILCGITIGESAMVGAGSVVTKDIPPFTLVYGNPACMKGLVGLNGRKVSDRK